MSELNGTAEAVSTPVEVVSNSTAGALLPLQAERISELKSELNTVKSNRFAVAATAVLAGVGGGWLLATVFMPPREKVITVDRPYEVEKPVIVDRYCLFACK